MERRNKTESGRFPFVLSFTRRRDMARRIEVMWGKRFALTALLASLALANARFTLKQKGILGIPVSYTSVETMDGASYGYDKGAGEQMAIDMTLNFAYVVGETGLLHVVNMADPANMQIAKVVTLPQGATDVEMCGNYVAVAVEGAKKTDNGQVLIYDKYTAASPGMALKQTLTTGPLPDMIKFKHDCTVLLAANEGEAAWDGETFVNPPGSVTMFEFAGGNLTSTPTTTTIEFDAISGDKDSPNDALATALFAAGVGWQLGPHTPGLPAAYDNFQAEKSLTRNLEPEYIAFSTDETKAYICLQEASAIATVDLATKTVTKISPMGEKDWKALDLAFDASDKDGGVNMQVWPVVGRYMPDSIATFAVGGVDYIATANEGDVVEYGVDTDNEFACELRGVDMADKLDSSIDSNPLQNSLQCDALLGRLKFDCSCGLTAAGKYDKLCALSTRSWSIFKADTMELVWDSGSDVEKVLNSLHPDIFNSDAADPGDAQADEMDSRSDDKGAEVESLAIGVIDGKTLIFVGLERASAIMIYDASDPTAPVFHSIMHLGSNQTVPAGLKDGVETSQASAVGVLDPESLFVDTEKRQLVVAGSVSGTIAVYDIAMDDEAVTIIEERNDVVQEPEATRVTLTQLGIIMIPAEYETVATMANPSYKYGVGAGEQMTLDKKDKIAYIVGETAIMHVVDMGDQSNMKIEKAVQLPQGATDVEMCGNYVAVAVEGAKKTDNGQVLIYDKYTAASPGMALKQTLTTGPLPDMIKFKHDCTVLLAANEGEAAWDGETFVNPPGSVTMFEFAGGDLTSTPTTTTIEFDAISGDKDSPNDALATALFAAGVGWQLGPHTPGLPAAYDNFQAEKSLTRNLEPEYIAFSTDETKAYICLQEASAIATVDLATKTVTKISPMGEKDWKALDLAFDASDKDGGVNMQVWPVVGRYMPDSIATFAVGGVDYIATANEGDVVEYGVDTDNEFACELRGGDMADKLDASIDACALKTALLDDAQLGRLKFDCSCGLTAAGKYDKLCALSTRSWSIFKADTMELVWDSGSDVEKVLNSLHPDIFNSDAADPGDAQADEMDSRSDDKGAEVESLAIGVIDGKTLIFVGLERASVVMIYDASDPTAPVFHSSMHLGSNQVVPAALTDGTSTSQASLLGVLDPEALYVDEANRMLIVAGSGSGTIAAYSINFPISTAVGDIPTNGGVKVYAIADSESMITFPSDAFTSGVKLLVWEQDVSAAVSPPPGTRAAATRAIRLFSSAAPTKAIKVILKLISVSRRADTAFPIVHWLNQKTNKWLPVCTTTATNTGAVQADLPPAVLSHEGFDPSSGCHSALSKCESGDGGFIAAFYIDTSVCDPPQNINFPISVVSDAKEEDGSGLSPDDAAKVIVGVFGGTIALVFAACMILTSMKTEPAHAAPSKRDIEVKTEPAHAASSKRDIEVGAPVKEVDAEVQSKETPSLAFAQPQVAPTQVTPSYTGPYQPPPRAPTMAQMPPMGMPVSNWGMYTGYA